MRLLARRDPVVPVLSGTAPLSFIVLSVRGNAFFQAHTGERIVIAAAGLS